MPKDAAPLFSTIIDAYGSVIVRLYCKIRFRIIHRRFLNEIGQYLPKKGRVLDCGCGFGLFSLYYASCFPDVEFVGIDLNEKRIGIAKKAAAALGLKNVQYFKTDVTSHDFHGPFDAAYMLDIIHHIPPDAVEPLVAKLSSEVTSGGKLIIKDVLDRPWFHRTFTWFLDKCMDPKTPVFYWSQDAVTSLLKKFRNDVVSHEMVDVLPYPHVLYIARNSAPDHAAE